MTNAEFGDAEDEMRQLVDGLGLDSQAETLRGTADVNVQTLSEGQLAHRYNHLKEELWEREEMLEPKTDTAKDMHAQMLAYKAEMIRRGMRGKG